MLLGSVNFSQSEIVGVQTESEYFISKNINEGAEASPTVFITRILEQDSRDLCEFKLQVEYKAQAEETYSFSVVRGIRDGLYE